MTSSVEDAVLLFGGTNDGVINKAQAIDALSAMGVTVRDSDADALLSKDVNAAELAEIASKLRLKNIDRNELTKLIHDLNPTNRGTISRGTLQYILKTNHRLSDKKFEEFIRDLNLREEDGMVESEALVNALMAVLN